MPHFKSLPCAATNVNLQLVSNYNQEVCFPLSLVNGIVTIRIFNVGTWIYDSLNV